MVAVLIQAPNPVALGAQLSTLFYVFGSIGILLGALAFGAKDKPAVRRVVTFVFVALLVSAGVAVADTVGSCGWCDPFWCQFMLCLP